MTSVSYTTPNENTSMTKSKVKTSMRYLYVPPPRKYHKFNSTILCLEDLKKKERKKERNKEEENLRAGTFEKALKKLEAYPDQHKSRSQQPLRCSFSCGDLPDPVARRLIVFLKVMTARADPWANAIRERSPFCQFGSVQFHVLLSRHVLMTPVALNARQKTFTQ